MSEWKMRPATELVARDLSMGVTGTRVLVHGESALVTEVRVLGSTQPRRRGYDAPVSLKLSDGRQLLVRETTELLAQED